MPSASVRPANKSTSVTLQYLFLLVCDACSGCLLPPRRGMPPLRMGSAQPRTARKSRHLMPTPKAIVAVHARRVKDGPLPHSAWQL